MKDEIMSLVGPRPVVQKELDDKYGAMSADYLKVRPGITGLWQVYRTSSTTYSDRVRMDVSYAKNWSLKGDVWLLLLTIPSIIKNRHF